MGLSTIHSLALPPPERKGKLFNPPLLIGLLQPILCSLCRIVPTPLVSSIVVKNPAYHDDELVTELALAAGRGDRDALARFIRATQDDVWRLLAHLGGPECADDLTQETYLRVLSALPRFAARSSARTWLLSLARRVWVDNIRHDMARPRKSSTDYDEVAASRPDQGTNPATWSAWIDARTVINQLPEERREALILTQILGYTYEEAARIAGVRVGTIRSRVARARKDVIEATKIEDSPR